MTSGPFSFLKTYSCIRKPKTKNKLFPFEQVWWVRSKFTEPVVLKKGMDYFVKYLTNSNNYNEQIVSGFCFYFSDISIFLKVHVPICNLGTQVLVSIARIGYTNFTSMLLLGQINIMKKYIDVCKKKMMMIERKYWSNT